MEIKRHADGALEREPLCDNNWIQQNHWPESPGGEPFSVVDLFCGCGGMSLGAFEAARRNNRSFKVQLAVDFSAPAIGVYRANFACDEHRALQEDIQTLFPGVPGMDPYDVELGLRDRIAQPDLILAGPPCQGHSDLNNHTRRNDPRNSLYLKVVRAVEILLPKAVIIENVATVIHDRNGVTHESRYFFETLGYAVADFTLKAWEIGLAQKRTRHFLVATRRGGPFDPALCMQMAKSIRRTVRDVIGDLEDESAHRSEMYFQPSGMMAQNIARVNYLFENDCFDLPDSQRPRCHRDKSHSYLSMYGRMHFDKPAQTITSGFGSMGQGRFVHPTRKRTITPHEAARIQGFPDFFDFSTVARRTHLQEVIGNAVPPRISALLVHHLLHHHF